MGDARMDAMYTSLLLEKDGAVATVTINRPAVLNALDATVFDELEQVFRALADDAAVRVVLLSGAGERAFAAGADIRGLAGKDVASGRALSERGHAVFGLIAASRKPVIACIHGLALGGGCELALACTLRLAGTNAKLGLPEAKLGLIPGYGGTQRLPRLIGRSAALKLMLTGEFVPAAEALRLGLVDEVVAPEGLLSRAKELAATIAANAPLAVAGALEAVERGEDLPLERAMDVEAEVFGRLCGTEDKREGVGAFLDKRAAVWRGR